MKSSTKRNILTIGTIVGFVSTVGLAISATPKAIKILEETDNDIVEKAKRIIPNYIPTILCGGVTIACIVANNRMDAKCQAQLISAYALLDKSFREYRNKIKEYSESSGQNVEYAITKDRISVRLSGIDSIHPRDEIFLFYFEDYFDELFERTHAQVLAAEYELNRKFVRDGEATLNDFFEFLKLPTTSYGDAIGWSTGYTFDAYDTAWIDFSHETIYMDDGMECISISPVLKPTLCYKNY